MQYIIIGNGVAGITAARTLRTQDAAARITVYTNELQTGFYIRKDLARHLANGGIDEALIYAETSESLRQLGIEVIYDPVLKVFPRSNQVLINHAIRKTYDALLIASGATPRLLDVPGYALLGVHQARSYEDFTFIDNWLPELRQDDTVVVIGGGVLGMDMAYALARRGAQTALLVRDAAVGAPWLNAEQAETAAGRLSQIGVAVKLNATVSAFESLDGRVLDQIKLANGKPIPARMAICCIGVTPNTDFLEESGIEIDSATLAIPVNQQFQTNFSNVYAAGSCALVNGEVAHNWTTAEAQGRSAALAMLGQEADYRLPDNAAGALPLVLEG